MAQEAPAHLQAAEVSQAIAEWEMTTADFWKAHAVDAENKPKPPQKLFRSKAWSWLAATDHQLRAFTGRGWDAWYQPSEPSERKPYLEWTFVTVSLDQGSDGWSAVSYMAWHRHCNIYIALDASHRVWNDVEGAIRSEGLWSTCLLGIVLLNMDVGPWASAKWYTESQQALGEYLSVADTTCPIFQGLKSAIAREREMSVLRGVDNFDGLLSRKSRRRSRRRTRAWG